MPGWVRAIHLKHLAIHGLLQTGYADLKAHYNDLYKYSAELKACDSYKPKQLTATSP